MDTRSIPYKFSLIIGALIGMTIGEWIAPKTLYAIFYSLGGALIGVLVAGGVIHLFIGTKLEMTKKEERDPTNMLLLTISQLIFGLIGYLYKDIIGLFFGALIGMAVASYIQHSKKEEKLKAEKEAQKREAYREWLIKNSKKTEDEAI